MFVAQADGTWKPELAAPGSPRLSADHLSATFRMRPGAAWSDGSPVTVDDLRRSADARFVAGLDRPDPRGVITLRFVKPMVGWERLWSGTSSVTPPRPGLWGGPFVVATYTRGLELVLRRNDRWWGDGGPYLDEVRLEVVPDATTARQLLQREQLDVVMSPAGLQRTPLLRQASGAKVLTAPVGGWWTGLDVSSHLTLARRTALAGTVDRDRFVSVLMAGEAEPVAGLAGKDDETWKKVTAAPANSLGGGSLTLTGEREEPMLGLLERSMQKKAAAGGGALDLRNAQASEVEAWLGSGEYEGAISMHYDSPSVCWTCRFGSVDAGLAAAADSGDAGAARSLEARVRAAALLVPLWRPLTVVAVSDGLNGVAANGYGLSAAWDAVDWWRSS
jgi:hypothetical protein